MRFAICDLRFAICSDLSQITNHKSPNACPRSRAPIHSRWIAILQKNARYSTLEVVALLPCETRLTPARRPAAIGASGPDWAGEPGGHSFFHRHCLHLAGRRGGFPRTI